MRSLFIEIPRRGRTCQSCGRVFAPGMVYLSLLFEQNKESTYIREDFCSGCGNDKISEANSYWKSSVPLKTEEIATEKRNKEEQALELLKEIVKGGSSEELAEAFILALYLARKRIIQFKKEMRKSASEIILLYEVCDTEEMLCIRQVPLSQLNVPAIQERIAKKLL